jgi:adenylate kinase family enzyme
MKIHILGAPGSGVTTLGKGLAMRLAVPCFDTDDYHWFTNDALPYRRRRNPDHRRQLMGEDLSKHESWVLSGAMCGWGDVFIPLFDRVIYLWLPVETRLTRIRERETLRYGAARIEPGGDLFEVFEKFMSWAAAYDEPTGNIRSFQKEQEWLQAMNCPVLKFDQEKTLGEMLQTTQDWLNNA